MEQLPHEPRTFREVVEADLRRAARLIIKVQDEIDLQLRIVTPGGDWAIAVTLPQADAERRAILADLTTFMAWKQAEAFTLASELIEPDSVTCVGVSARERHGCLSRITRHPRPWSTRNFGAVEWLPASSIDPVIAALLPSGPRPLTPKEVAAMTRRFGRDGAFPAVNLATGAVGV